MRGALLNVPFYNNLISTVTSSTSGNSRTSGSDATSQVADGTTSNSDPFRTVAVSDIDPAYCLANNGCTNENLTLSQSAIQRERLLTFRSDMSTATAVMASSTTSTTATTPIASSSPSTMSPMRYNNHVSIVPDPYLQDQLRVLNRTYGRKNITASTSSPMDTIAMEEAALRSVAKKIGRKISTVPIRILDAPNLVDDYYLNLVSWSLDNILAVALGQSVYLWYAATEQIDHLLTLTGSDDYVTSVCWCNQDGNTNYIAVGTNDSTVQLWDASTLQKLRTLKGHSARVGSLAWNRQHWLSSGSRDSSIIQHDVRVPQNRVATYIGHTQEVCGLKWSYDGSTLASGGNENFLCLWDASMSSANMRSRQLPSSNTSHDLNDLITTVSARVTLTQHKAAVKALAWCPFHRGLLASGGGTADVSEPNVSFCLPPPRFFFFVLLLFSLNLSLSHTHVFFLFIQRSIKFWNSNSGALLNSVDTGSQVCSLLWSTHSKEICSSHGFSEYQLILWKYPSMAKIQEFTGHHARVLHMEPSPDGSCIVSAAADETLRFWDIFGSAPMKNHSSRSLLSIGGVGGTGYGSAGMALTLR